MMYDTSDFRNGLKVEMDGNPYVMVYFQFVKPGKGTAFTRTKLKNMRTGAVIERTFRTGEKLQAADVDEVNANYLYEDGTFAYFMNQQTYEQVAIPLERIKDEKQYLTENLDVHIVVFKGEPLIMTLPNFIESEITYCEPGARGNTAQGASKPATLACGVTVNVPLFVDQGEIVRVDTRTGEYVGRVKE
jgi:elongation factor P